MSELFTPIDPAELILQTFRAVDPKSLADRINAFFAGYVPIAAPYLRSIRVSAAGEGASWSAQLVGIDTEDVAERTDIPFDGARVCFREVNDAEPNFNVQIAECINEIRLANVPDEPLVAEQILEGAGAQIWLVGVVARLAAPPPPPPP